MSMLPRRPVFALHSLALAAATASLCVSATAAAPSADAQTRALRQDVQNIVVIYAENRSFDSLFGDFPSSDNLSSLMDDQGRPTAAYIPQVDRDGTALPTLPQTWGGLTAPGNIPVVTQAQSAGLPNRPFQVDTAFEASAHAKLDLSTVTRDMYHRFFENQMQIDGGKNDQFVAWGDSGGLVMGHFDARQSSLYKLAQQYVLADHFFQGAFGGSFLNHQYLICACAPVYPNADTSPAKGSISQVYQDADGGFLPLLKISPRSPASAMDGKPAFVLSGNLTPKNYFGDGQYYAVNTMQPPFQPSGNGPKTAEGEQALYADPAGATTLPAQTASNIGDLLSARKVSWKWYAGAWYAALADGQQPASATRKVIYAADTNGVSSPAAVDFQTHHQPFNYYADMDPVKNAEARKEHLQDYVDLVKDAAAGTLPAVAFYKPAGLYNQHPGYANVAAGDAHIADLIAKLQASPQWKHMVIVVTYDENGGAWDHVAPPVADKLGPGTRIPAIIISPLARKGTVDHTPYDTGSVLRLITRRFDLPALPGLRQRDEALKAHGQPPMGDLTAALDLSSH